MSNNTLNSVGLRYDTPLAMLTIGQFLDVVRDTKKDAHTHDSREYLYGLRGIQQEFHISHKTAQAWKNTWLAPAIEQTGKVILCDKAKAHELLAQRETKRR